MLATGGAIRSTGEAIAPPVNMLDEALTYGQAAYRGQRCSCSGWSFFSSVFGNVSEQAREEVCSCTSSHVCATSLTRLKLTAIESLATHQN